MEKNGTNLLNSGAFWSDSAAKTLPEILSQRANYQSGQKVFTFYADRDLTEQTVTFSHLDHNARRCAAILEHYMDKYGISARRAILIYPPGLDYIYGFLGCLYAGVVAIPAYPPQPALLERTFPRLEMIAADSGAGLILTTSSVMRSLFDWLKKPENCSPVRSSRLLSGLSAAFMYSSLPADQPVWIATDSDETAHRISEVPLLAATPADLPFSGASPDTRDIAFLQYTSGTTGTPKGTMVTHENIIHNSSVIRASFEIDPEKDEIVIWLPFYHDMGLIGGIIQPIFSGTHCHLLSTLSFLSWPTRWLQIISGIKGKSVISGGPNFAYDLVIKKAGEARELEIDLSRWDVAFSGAEPISFSTLENFSETFKKYGFRKEAFYACYGMAESTLMASGGRRGEFPKAKVFKGTGDGKTETVTNKMVVGCGRPGQGLDIAIVEPESKDLLESGRIGEIWLKGKSIAKGYWNKPAESHETFQAYSSDGRGPFLRTGDLGFLEDNELYVTGRLKDLIIIRGTNYYPQDIEETIQKYDPLLRQNCGTAFSILKDNSERLVIVQEIQPGAQSDANGIIKRIRKTISECFDIQVYSVVLTKAKSVPKTSSGKLQRNLTRERYLQGQLAVLAEDTIKLQDLTPVGSARPEEVPASPQWQSAPDSTDIASFSRWFYSSISSILGTESISSEASLFESGIDSISTVELKNLLEDTLHILVSFEDLLNSQSIGELTLLLYSRYTAAGKEEAAAPLPDTNPNPVYPLSFNQSSMWLMQQLSPQSAAFNVFFSARIHGRTDAEALKETFDILSQMHPVLKAIITEENGVPCQRICDDHVDYFRIIETGGWSPRRLKKAVTDEAHRPFDLASGGVFRAALFTGHDTECDILLLNFHHIAVDLWSIGLMLSQIAGIYQSITNRAIFRHSQQAGSSYRDFVYRQASMVSSDEGKAHLSFWQEQLRPSPVSIEIPRDKERPEIKTFSGRVFPFVISTDLSRRLREFAANENATLYTILLAAFNILLYNYSGQTDIAVGTPVSGRNKAAYEKTAGYFVNTAVIRSSIDPFEKFSGYLCRLQRTVTAVLDHQDYPFSLLVEKLNPARLPGRSPFFDIMFVLERQHILNEISFADFMLPSSDKHRRKVRLGSLELSPYPIENKTAQFDLTLTIYESGGSLNAAIQYNTDLFEQQTIEKISSCYTALLNNLLSGTQMTTGELSLLSDQRKQRLLSKGTNPADENEYQFIYEHFRRNALQRPDDTALLFSPVPFSQTHQPCSRLSYRELELMASAIADKLLQAGLKPGDYAGVALPRSAGMIASILAILKTRGVYVPLDPAYPIERLLYIAEDSGMRFLLADEKFLLHDRGIIPASVAIIPIDTDIFSFAAAANLTSRQAVPPDPLSTAYMIYTSGSTGRPKGVMIPHRSFSLHCLNMSRYFGVSKDDRFLQFASFSFDASLEQIFTTFIAGATLVLRDNELWTPEEFTRKMIDYRLTIINVPPAYAEELIDHWLKEPGELRSSSLRMLIVGGEKITVNLYRKWQQLNCQSIRFINAYGPTETTITSMAFDAGISYGINATSGSLPIGGPTPGRCVYILNSNLMLLEEGIAGELFIGGLCPASGYKNLPGLTTERFLPDPFSKTPGSLMYRSGDIARYLSDGNIEYLGRSDGQVKMRGFRIETGEIESAILEFPQVKNAAVILHELNQGSDKVLSAYIVLKATAEGPDIPGLKGFLMKKLPAYMIPSEYYLLDSIPLTGSGKTDRLALPAAASRKLNTEGGRSDPPANILEKMLSEILSELLKKDAIGRTENFFELGGHSLLAMQAVSRIRERFNVQIKLSDFFQSPDIQGLARTVLSYLLKNRSNETAEKILRGLV